MAQGGAVGIDLGIARFATLSDGTVYAPLNSFRRHETALRKAQQAMNHKTGFGNNWKKGKARIQRIHARIGNVRRNYLHQTTTTISKNHATVCIEDLQVRNMSRSAGGTAAAPVRVRGMRLEANADMVGAINILRAGHARFACEVSGAVRPPAAGTRRSDSIRLDA